jgi:putative salt-induced outer membrane protein YdiY
MPAFAQETPKTPEEGWKDTAEFSYVVTSGNSETQTLGFKDKLWRRWERSAFELNLGGVRAESTTTTEIFATGTPSDFYISETKATDVTAENYYLNGRYDRKITDRFFWFGGAGWDRNRPAGINNRYAGAGGVGNIWVDRETVKFRTDYSITYTKQENVVEDPGFDDTFTGARISYAYVHKFGKTTIYTSDLALDDNLEETPDYRANMINAVAVSMSSRLALKLSLQWLFDNRPSFREVDLFSPPGQRGVLIGTVLDELDKLDTIFTSSLVVNL